MVFKNLIILQSYHKKLLLVTKLQLSPFSKRQIFHKIRKRWLGPQEPPPPTTIKERLFALSHLQMIGLAAATTALILIPGIFYLTHIDETPLTRRRRFLLFNPYQFHLISHELYSMFVSAHKKDILSSARSEYSVIQRVANRIIQSNLDVPELAKTKWNVTIINEPNQNIFVLPSGEIVVYEGIFRICTNDDELAVVLGHEMAHAFMGHTAELTNGLNVLDKLWMIFLLSVWAILPHSPSYLVQLFAKKLKGYFLYVPYEDTLELEADKVAIKLVARACYDVRQMTALWSKLEAMQSMNVHQTIDWLYVHPNHKQRAEVLNLLIPDAILTREQSNCPGLSQHDPRLHINKFRENYEKGGKLTSEPKSPAHRPDDLAPHDPNLVYKHKETHYSYAGQHHHDEHSGQQHPSQSGDQHSPHQHPGQQSQQPTKSPEERRK